MKNYARFMPDKSCEHHYTCIDLCLDRAFREHPYDVKMTQGTQITDQNNLEIKDV